MKEIRWVATIENVINTTITLTLNRPPPLSQADIDRRLPNFVETLRRLGVKSTPGSVKLVDGDLYVDGWTFDWDDAPELAEHHTADRIRDAARNESTRLIEELRQLRENHDTLQREHSWIINSINQAIGNAGEHAALTFAEAVAKIAYDRDRARAALVEALDMSPGSVRMVSERIDELRKAGL